MVEKKQETNWCYLFFVVFLAVLSGGLIWRSMDEFYFPPIVFFEEKKESKPEKTEEIKTGLDKAALKCFCKEAEDFSLEEWGELKEVKYGQEEIDLNEDGVKEIMATGWECVFENHSFFIGGASGNQVFCIFQKQGGRWQEIGFIGGGGYGIQETRTNGYFDLKTNADGGQAGCLRIIIDYQWDGSYYQVADEEFKDVCLPD